MKSTTHTFNTLPEKVDEDALLASEVQYGYLSWCDDSVCACVWVAACQILTYRGMFEVFAGCELSFMYR